MRAKRKYWYGTRLVKWLQSDGLTCKIDNCKFAVPKV